jgi:hypothetical protein
MASVGTSAATSGAVTATISRYSRRTRPAREPDQATWIPEGACSHADTSGGDLPVGIAVPGHALARWRTKIQRQWSTNTFVEISTEQGWPAT